MVEKVDYLLEATKLAEHAVWCDFSGNLEEALETYEKAIAFLIEVTKGYFLLGSLTFTQKNLTL